jgi:hypothetical protein
MSNEMKLKKIKKFFNEEACGTNFIILDPFEETKVLAEFAKSV